MTQFYNPGNIATMVSAEVQRLVGETIGQAEFFSTRIYNDFREPSKGEQAGEYFIMIKYRSDELQIGLRFSMIESTDNRLLAVGGQWLYDGSSEWTELQARLGRHMRDRVGDTIVAFLEENKPSNAAATE